MENWRVDWAQNSAKQMQQNPIIFLNFIYMHFIAFKFWIQNTPIESKKVSTTINANVGLVRVLDQY